jgi:hypothetical protein
MRHYTCDGCGRDLTEAGSGRYAVTIDVQAADEAADLADGDLDANVVEETAALLRAIEDGLADDGDLATLPDRAAMEYDLCPGCYGDKDPIGRSRRPAWAFSPN